MPMRNELSSIEEKQISDSMPDKQNPILFIIITLSIISKLYIIKGESKVGKVCFKKEQKRWDYML